MAARESRLDAGILYVDVLESELETVDEAAFRSYRLGQWLDVAVASWLPVGSWESNPSAEVPPPGSEIVLGLAGTWRSAVALVVCSLDGELTVVWYADRADDEDLRDAVEEAARRWAVVEIVVAPRIRPRLVHDWAEEGVPVLVWSGSRDDEVASSSEFRRAIVDGRLPHDHDPFLAADVAALVGRSNPDGTLVLVAPNEETDVSAARAARDGGLVLVISRSAPSPRSTDAAAGTRRRARRGFGRTRRSPSCYHRDPVVRPCARAERFGSGGSGAGVPSRPQA